VKRSKLIINLFAGVLLLAANVALAKPPVQLVFWHSMAGSFGQVVDHLVNEFNRTHPNIKVTPIYKGTYPETLTSTVAAFRARQQPDIVQIFEVGTATMIHPAGAIRPVYQVFKDAKVNAKTGEIFPAIAAYYSDLKHRLLALPFNSSSAVMYYNKKEFKKAGLNPNKPPRTWPEVKRDAKALQKAGVHCGFTTTWPSWIQLEMFSAWHNLPFATKANGFAGLGARVNFNNRWAVRHISTLARWEKSHIFVYGGRGDNAQSLFTSGQCAMMMQSSGSNFTLQHLVKFPIGVGPLPYWPDIPGAPQNTAIGGGALWVMNRLPADHYPAIATFLAFLMQPKQLVYFQTHTGYFPLTKAAYRLAKAKGYYRQYPGAEVALQQLNHKPPTDHSRGIRLGNYARIRNINDEALEGAWSGHSSARDALDAAVKRDNILLKRFQASAGG
jgi:sn-glycerol 3-phosphate transport system substrate-binding protein